MNCRSFWSALARQTLHFRQSKKDFVKVICLQVFTAVSFYVGMGAFLFEVIQYAMVPTDYRLSIDRGCPSFKRTYALRTECERYNSHFKAAG